MESISQVFGSQDEMAFTVHGGRPFIVHVAQNIMKNN